MDAAFAAFLVERGAELLQRPSSPSWELAREAGVIPLPVMSTCHGRVRRGVPWTLRSAWQYAGVLGEIRSGAARHGQRRPPLRPPRRRLLNGISGGVRPVRPCRR